MRILLVLASVLVGVPSAGAAEFSWNGNAGVRHLIRNLTDGLETKDPVTGKDMSTTKDRRWEFKATIGATVKTEHTDWGFDIRTVPTVTATSSRASEWVAASSGGDFAATVGQAYGRYHTSMSGCDWSVTVGRQKPGVLFDGMAQMLFDNDLRFDGFSWSWKHDMFGMNLAQYVLGSTNRGTPASNSSFTYTDATQDNANTKSFFGVLYSFQPFVQFKINEEITSLFAVGYHLWSGTGGNDTTGWYNNPVHGGTVGTVGDLTPVSMDNTRQLQLLSDTSLPFNLRFVAEYVMNKKVLYGTRLQTAGTTTRATDHDALAFSLAWNKPKKAGDIGLVYSFSDKGIGSVINSFTNGDIPADNRSHFFEAKYMLADGLSFGGKAQFHKEKAKLGGDGLPVASPDEKRLQSQQRYELVTTVQL